MILASLRWLLPAILTAALILPLRSAVADWNDVPTGSMWPTILEGDRIYVDKLAYGLRLPFTTVWLAEWDRPARGDIIVFASPADGTRLVKRVIGLPGDRIAMSRNQLTVNGETLRYDELPGRQEKTLPNGRTLPMIVATESLPGRVHPVAWSQGIVGKHTFSEFVVPADHYFFMGDNRDQSFDSRFIGTVERESIYGRATAVAISLDPDHSYWPRFDRWFTAIH